MRYEKMLVTENGREARGFRPSNQLGLWLIRFRLFVSCLYNTVLLHCIDITVTVIECHGYLHHGVLSVLNIISLISLLNHRRASTCNGHCAYFAWYCIKFHFVHVLPGRGLCSIQPFVSTVKSLLQISCSLCHMFLAGLDAWRAADQVRASVNTASKIHGKNA